MSDDFDTTELMVRMTECRIAAFTDPRGVFGTDPTGWRPEAQPQPDLRREAWAWIACQWELWPRPDLVRAILPPAITRPSRRNR